MFGVVSFFFPSLVALSLAGQVPAGNPAPTATPSASAKPSKAPKPEKPKPEAKPAAEASPADALAARVQRYYDKTTDFSADFVQSYTRVALSKVSESKGAVKVLKPGMMRWDYSSPQAKHFIADGKQLFVYDPEDQHVSIDPAFQLSDQGSSLSFLWGKGKLADEFTLSVGGEPDVLDMVPKKDATYTKLSLRVDASGQVIESTLFETAGNTNRFRFSNVKTNSGLEAGAFQFTPPPGAEVVTIRR